MMRLKLTIAAAFMLAMAAPSVAACPTRWTSLFSFGDSYSDSGAGYVDGNGPTAVAYVARDLQIPFTYFGDPDMAGKGINFAVSAARTGSEPGGAQTDKTGRYHAYLGRGMLLQVGEFSDGVKQKTIRFNPDTTLFFLAGGLNDEASKRQETLDHIKSEITTLYALGGRYFYVALVPEAIPQFPNARTLNPLLTQIPGELQHTLPGAHVWLSNWGPYFDDIFRHPGSYGITNITDKCAGRALLNEAEVPCASPATHFFYHDGHPSTAVHAIVGRKLAGDARKALASIRATCTSKRAD